MEQMLTIALVSNVATILGTVLEPKYAIMAKYWLNCGLLHLQSIDMTPCISKV
jgi:hypothetical protein